MTCKIHTLELPEIQQFFNGGIIFFEFLESEHPKERKGNLDQAKTEAINQLIKKMGKSTPSTRYNYHYLESIPTMAISISHTKTLGVVILSERKNYESIGVDIEYQDRQFQPKTAKFFINSNDENSDLLTIWTKKEAAFKACSPIIKECKLLKDISVANNNFQLQSKKTPLGQVKSFYQKIKDRKVIISIAFITKLN